MLLLCAMSHLIFSTIQGSNCYCPHFIDEENEGLEGLIMVGLDRWLWTDDYSVNRHTHTHTHTHTHSHTYPYRHRDLIVFLLEFKKVAFSFLFFLHSQGLDESSEIPRKTIYISKGTERGIPVPSRKLTSNSKSQFFNVKSPIFNIFRVSHPPPSNF